MVKKGGERGLVCGIVAGRSWRASSANSLPFIAAQVRQPDGPGVTIQVDRGAGGYSLVEGGGTGFQVKIIIAAGIVDAIE